jgi:hypothetical protein
MSQWQPPTVATYERPENPFDAFLAVRRDEVGPADQNDNSLQFIRNERRERVLIAAQPRRDDCLIRGVPAFHRFNV